MSTIDRDLWLVHDEKTGQRWVRITRGLALELLEQWPNADVYELVIGSRLVFPS